MIELGAFTGLRPDELIGLRWDDVDFEQLVSHVRRSVVAMVEGTPKTRASQKDVPLDAQTAESLFACGRAARTGIRALDTQAALRRSATRLVARPICPCIELRGKLWFRFRLTNRQTSKLNVSRAVIQPTGCHDCDACHHMFPPPLAMLLKG